MVDAEAGAAVSLYECQLNMTGYTSYYRHGLYDSSGGCWGTDFALSAAVVCCAVWLFRAHNAKHVFLIEHTRLWIIAKFLFTAGGTFMAATVHSGMFGRAGDVSSGINRLIWVYAVEAGGIFGGACLFCACFSLMTTEDNTKRNVCFYVAVFVASVLAILAFIHVFGDDYFIITGVVGDLLPDTVLAICLAIGTVFKLHERHWRANFRRGARWMWAGIFFIWVGSAVQVLLGSSCGVPCPVTCPFPAPEFDHNGAFHCIWIFAFALLTYGVNLTCTVLEDEAVEQQKSNREHREPLMP